MKLQVRCGEARKLTATGIRSSCAVDSGIVGVFPTYLAAIAVIGLGAILPCSVSDNHHISCSRSCADLAPIQKFAGQDEHRVVGRRDKR